MGYGTHSLVPAPAIRSFTPKTYYIIPPPHGNKDPPLIKYFIDYKMEASQDPRGK
jgi:hypothetical protein